MYYKLEFPNGDFYVTKTEQTAKQYMMNLKAGRPTSKLLEEAYQLQGFPKLLQTEEPKGNLNFKAPKTRKYTQEQLIEVLELIIAKTPNISQVTGVHQSTINNIANKISHTWLAEYFPDFYDSTKKN